MGQVSNEEKGAEAAKPGGPGRHFILVMAVAVTVSGAVMLPAWRGPLLGLLAGMVFAAALAAYYVRKSGKWILGLAALREEFNITQAAMDVMQVLGAVWTLIGLFVIWQQAQVAQDQQVSERFTASVQLLSDSKLESRIGGIYSLERLAKDSPRDRSTVGELLSSFVRQNAIFGQPRRTSEDINAALKVLGRQKDFSFTEESGGLFLAGSDFSGLDFTGLDFTGANFENCTLKRTNLSGTNFSGANLRSAIMAGAVFDPKSRLAGAKLEGADLSSAVGLTKKELDKASTNQATLLPEPP
jgi:hypothetical protein